MFLFTGCPRSGTKYTALLLQQLGLNVVHDKEIENVDGIVDWKCAVLKKILNYNPVIQLVRNPLDVIGSLTTIKDYSWKYIRNHILLKNAPLISNCMEMWLEWNNLIEGTENYRIQVESLNLTSCVNLLTKAGIGYVVNRTQKEISKDINSRKHIKLSWDQLMFTDKGLTYRVKEKAKLYGYRIVHEQNLTKQR